MYPSIVYGRLLGCIKGQFEKLRTVSLFSLLAMTYQENQVGQFKSIVEHRSIKLRFGCWKAYQR